MAELSADTFIIKDGAVVSGAQKMKDSSVGPANVSGFNVIRVEADFGTPSAGAYTLNAEAYLIDGDVSIANNLICPDGCTILGHSPDISKLTRTSDTGTFITMTDARLNISNLTVSCPGMTAFSCDNSVGGVLKGIEMVRVRTISSARFMDLTDAYANLTRSVGLATTSGIRQLGTTLNPFISVELAFISVSGASANALDLGTTVLEDLILRSSTLVANGTGGIPFKGAASNGNIQSGDIANVDNVVFTGDTATVLSGISETDTRYRFFACKGVPDSQVDGLLAMNGNSTETTINTDGVPELVAGTWTVEETKQMTGTTGGRLTFEPETSQSLPITVSVSAKPASGGTVALTAYIAIDGSTIANSAVTFEASSSRAKAVSIPWQYEFDEDTYVEVYIANEDNTTNIIVEHIVLRVN